MKILPLIGLLVSLNTTGQVALPYYQDFENKKFPPEGMQINPELPGWMFDSISAYGNGKGCVYFDNFGNKDGTYDIRLPLMNFSNVKLPFIKFDVAYAMSRGKTDELGIWWSTNGSGWQNLQNYSANTLVTTSDYNGPFRPTEGEWRSLSYPLKYIAGQPNVYLKLQDVCSNGNRIYIDNISVFDSALTKSKSDFEKKFFVYPDVANNMVKVNNWYSKSFRFDFYDIYGQKVISKEMYGIYNMIDISDYKNQFYYYRVIAGDHIKSGFLTRYSKVPD